MVGKKIRAYREFRGYSQITDLSYCSQISTLAEEFLKDMKQREELLGIGIQNPIS